MVHLRQRLARFVKEKRGKTPQRVFARRIGVAQSTIMRIENEDQNVTLDTLESLCQAFHAEIADLFPPMDVGRQYSPRMPVGLNVPAQGSHVTLHDQAPAHDTGKSQGARSGHIGAAAKKPSIK